MTAFLAFLCRYEVIDTVQDIYCVLEYLPNGELFEYIVSRGRVFLLSFSFLCLWVILALFSAG